MTQFHMILCQTANRINHWCWNHLHLNSQIYILSWNIPRSHNKHQNWGHLYDKPPPISSNQMLLQSINQEVQYQLFIFSSAVFFLRKTLCKLGSITTQQLNHVGEVSLTLTTISYPNSPAKLSTIVPLLTQLPFNYNLAELTAAEKVKFSQLQSYFISQTRITYSLIQLSLFGHLVNNNNTRDFMEN